jgi:hypothetical protein
VGKSGGYWKYTLGVLALVLLAVGGLQLGRQRLQKDIALRDQSNNQAQ